jgi:Putative lumazine-binding
VPVLTRLALVVAVLTLAACGKERPTQAVRKSVERFGKAVAARDYQELCDNLLAGNLIAALEERGVPCELALKTGLGDAKSPKLTIKTIAVNGNAALVGVHSTAANQPPSDDTLGLVKEHGKWKVSKLSRPEPQPPVKP